MTMLVIIMEENQPLVPDNKGKIPILELNSENNNNSLSNGIKDEIHDGMIDGKYLSKTKLGEGLSFASLIFGIFALIFSSFGFFSGEFTFVSLPWATAAVITGFIGNRYQRLISTKFGFGVTGAILGLTALIVSIFMGLLMWG